jgi:ketosteroid isomerase-like protein
LTLSASSHRLIAPGEVLDHGRSEMNRNLGLLIASMLIGLAIPALGQQSDQQAAQDVEMQLLSAFNRQDAAGVASLFTGDGLRVTPQGIIQGREAIQKDLDKRFQSHFHDLSSTITVVRASGDSIWEAGEWSMMIGDRPVRGYFSATLVREGDKFKIREETFNVVPPASGQ